jgi:2-oxoglutarate ferredoxin oxidoreductase subunit alpha
MSQREDLVIRVAGEAGEGVLSTGQLLTLAAARAGYAVLTDSVPPAEIKGGHSLYQIRVSPNRLHSRGDAIDILLAFNQEGYERNIRELRDDGLLLFDATDFTPPSSGGRYKQHPLPLTDIAKRQLQFELGKNVVAVGAMAALFGLDPEYVRTLLHQRFARKGDDVLNKNYAALDAGMNYVKANIPEAGTLQLDTPPPGGPRIVVVGNHAIAMGAIAAECKVYSGYPITPATEIMEFLAGELPKVGGAVVQAEDEMSALGMAIGASYAGRRSMTATSGPGVSLMVELMGLASMAEIPVVVVDAQRAGPSTGMPTRQEQGDLMLAALGGHGEIQRIVLAPVSVTDCFWQAINAFNMADEFQMPVLLLSDTTLGVRSESIPMPDLANVKITPRLVRASNGHNGPGVESGYKRYALTESGISPMAIPGTEGGQYVSTGLEHNESGRPRSDPDNREHMMEKRARKFELARLAAPEAHYYGDQDADLGILCWGSTYGTVVEAIDVARSRGIRVAAMAPRMLWPLPDHQIKPFMDSKRVVIVPELNHSGQFAQLLRARYLREVESVLDVRGGVFTVERLVRAIEGVLQHA